MLVMACLRQNEWGLGAPRLFYIDSTTPILNDNNLDTSSNLRYDAVLTTFPDSCLVKSRAADIVAIVPSSNLAHLARSTSKNQTILSTNTMEANYIKPSSSYPNSNEINTPPSSPTSDMDALLTAEKEHPSPFDPKWRRLISCTLDTLQYHYDHTSSPNVPIMLRYSERMDLGSFLLHLTLSSGPVLLRAKPIGIQSNSLCTGSGKVVLWDEGEDVLM